MPNHLFSPFQIGPYRLAHRVVHAPTTRLRADPDDSRGYLGAPGIYQNQHIPGWRKIVDAVHAKGAFCSCNWATMAASRMSI